MKRDDDNSERLNVQRRHLAGRLRANRERAGFSTVALAEKLGVDQSTISRWENGKRKINEVDLTKWLMACEATHDEIDELAGMVTARLVTDVDDAVWTSSLPADRTQQMDALLRAEETAESITFVAGLVIPGLLQTGDYARAVMQAHKVPQVDARTRVLERIGRRDIVTRKNRPTQVNAFIDEAVICRKVGGDDVMREQLAHLLELAQLPNVNVRIVPLAADWSPTHEGQFVLIDTADEKPVVHQETRRVGLFFNDQQDVKSYREAVAMVEKKAMDPADSQRSIAERQQKLETQ